MPQLLYVAPSGLVVLACYIHHYFAHMLGANAVKPGTNSNNNTYSSWIAPPLDKYNIPH